jgi:A/G-specific adenine glycosylase
MENLSAAKADLKWVSTTKLGHQPLTGLARKALQRLNLMALPQVTIRF